MNLKMTGQLAASEGDAREDYRALVCLFLGGGNDSFNMLVPDDETGYAEYASSRGDLALAREDLLPLNPGTLPDGRTLGVHPSLPVVRELYDGGKAAFVSNVGTLVEPTSLGQYQNQSVALPSGLFSHSDQAMHWQSSLPDDRSPLSGWGGRMGDLLKELNEVGGVSMNISLAGINLFQSGEDVTPFAIGTNGAIKLIHWNQSSWLPHRQAMEGVLAAEYANLFEQTFARMKREAISANLEFDEALSASADPVSEFSAGNPVSKQLKMVARTIAARSQLGACRQTFFVNMGGWDLHNDLDVSHPALLSTIDTAIGEFQAAMAELQIEDRVTLFTASDFARTLSSNGGGTDHAWGGNQIVVGGAVGSGLYGTYPDLALGSVLDTGRGRLIPTTSVDEYFCDLALWMGVSPSSMGAVLPNLHRFHDVMADGAPLGLFNS